MTVTLGLRSTQTVKNPVFNQTPVLLTSMTSPMAEKRSYLFPSANLIQHLNHSITLYRQNHPSRCDFILFIPFHDCPIKTHIFFRRHRLCVLHGLSIGYAAYRKHFKLKSFQHPRSLPPTGEASSTVAPNRTHSPHSMVT